MLLGVGGMLIAGVVQGLLVLGMITFQQSARSFPASFALGGWLTLSSYLGLSSHLLPRGLAWAGLLVGGGYIVTVAGFLLGGYQSLLFYTGGLLMVLCYLTWAFWLGRVFMKGNPVGLLSAILG